jgi:C4-type Zn-finger protein
MNQQVTIICPECDTAQPAVIDTYDIPGTDYVIDSYAHERTECGYLITESEWNEVVGII